MFYRHRRGRLALICVALTSSALLAGCETLDRMAAEGYQKECDRLGISRSSPAFETCVLQQQALEDQEVQHAMDREAMQHRSK